jgi:hypothetical protein
MIDLLEESERLLQSVEISTHLIETTRGKVLAFESATVLGFIVAYENPAKLIERWSADMERTSSASGGLRARRGTPIPCFSARPKPITGRG